MKLAAGPDTIRSVAEALKLAAILDDRVANADRNRIAAWAEQIERHNLERGDILDGIQAFYDSPSERPIGIGDLIHFGRQIRRDRTDREQERQFEERRAAQDTKAADEHRTFLTPAVGGGPVTNRTPRLIAADAALLCCVDKATAQAAINEYFAAKAEAKKLPATTSST